MAKTLIAYATRGGATKESADVIAKALEEKHGLEVDVVDLHKTHKPDISKYRNIVVGGGVRAGKIYGEALKFLDQDFGDRKVAFFVSTMEQDEKQRPLAEEKYIKKTLETYPSLKPVSTILLGGKYDILGLFKGSNNDLSKAEAWADDLASKFEK